MKTLSDFLSSIKNSRRLCGIFCIISGVGLKIGVAIYAATIKLWIYFTLYDKINSSADTLIYIGATLVGLTTADLFKKKND